MSNRVKRFGIRLVVDLCIVFVALELYSRMLKPYTTQDNRYIVAGIVGIAAGLTMALVQDKLNL